MSKLEEHKETILRLKKEGYGSRYIAKVVGSSKSTVNDFLKNIKAKECKREAKILLLDIESSPTMAAIWKLWKENIGLEQIKEDWFIMSYAAKWLGGNNIIQDDCRHTGNDKELLTGLHTLMSEADVVVCHNVKFDVPKIKARLLLNGFTPTSQFKTYCTLEAAKRVFGFTSNKLAYLADKLSKVKKSSHVKFPGFTLWSECLKGNMEAWEEMKVYNIDDIHSLEDVYLAIRPWDDKHPNVNVHTTSTKICCPVCGSEDIKKVDEETLAYTNTGVYHNYFCNNCGKYSRSRYTINTKEKRKSLLV